jgi:CRISPR-associated protein Cas1
MQLLNTLYVTTPESYIHLDNDTLRVEVEKTTRLRVPLHHLGAVVCFGYVSVSLPLMHRLADDGISLVLLDSHGRFKARLEGAVSGNVLLRQAQHGLGRDPAFALAVARNCVAGKVRNCRQVLLRGSREAKVPEDADASLTRCVRFGSDAARFAHGKRSRHLARSGGRGSSAVLRRADESSAR